MIHAVFILCRWMGVFPQFLKDPPFNFKKEGAYFYFDREKILRFKYSKTSVKRPLSKRLLIGFQDQLLLNVGQKYCRMLPLEHSVILLTFIKLPFVIGSLCINDIVPD